jgi:8-oxo-dGTP pyrophosphatase MutT (NUDIX family)
MKTGMDIKIGDYSARDFHRRVMARAFPLGAADDFAANTECRRGDHDLNPDFLASDPAGAGLRPASVLIGVVDRGDFATVILTQRAANLTAHGGQIALPGGRIDPCDDTAIVTAMREAHEEIGLEPEFVTPLGLLEPYRTRTGFRILPVLAAVSPELRLKADAREVAEIFEVPLGFLMTPTNHQRYSVKFEGKPRHFYAMPYGERYIWGATAGILRIMYERLYAE